MEYRLTKTSHLTVFAGNRRGDFEGAPDAPWVAAQQRLSFSYLSTIDSSYKDTDTDTSKNKFDAGRRKDRMVSILQDAKQGRVRSIPLTTVHDRAAAEALITWWIDRQIAQIDRALQHGRA